LDTEWNVIRSRSGLSNEIIVGGDGRIDLLPTAL
jgi:hypothetical protein